MEETWKDISGYEGCYRISNFGRVVSLPRKHTVKRERLLKVGLSSNGYLSINLLRDGLQKSMFIHHLVWDHFGVKEREGMRLVVDHRDNNRENNRIDNLQLLSQRENITKWRLNNKKNNLPIGVRWYEPNKKYRAIIGINGRNKHLGYFNDANKAGRAYQEELKNLRNL